MNHQNLQLGFQATQASSLGQVNGGSWMSGRFLINDDRVTEEDLFHMLCYGHKVLGLRQNPLVWRTKIAWKSATQIPLSVTLKTYSFHSFWPFDRYAPKRMAHSPVPTASPHRSWRVEALFLVSSTDPTAAPQRCIPKSGRLLRRCGEQGAVFKGGN